MTDTLIEETRALLNRPSTAITAGEKRDAAYEFGKKAHALLERWLAESEATAAQPAELGDSGAAMREGKA